MGVLVALAGCLSDDAAPRPREFLASNCAATACPASNWPDFDVSTLEIQGTPLVLMAGPLPVVMALNDRWVAWETHESASPANALFAYDRASDRILKLVPSRDRVAVMSLLVEDTVYFSEGTTPYGLADHSLPVVDQEFHYRLHAWHLPSNSRAPVDFPLDGSIVLVDWGAPWVLLRHNNGPMRLNGTEGETTLVYNLETRTILEPPMPPMFQSTVPTSNDAYLDNGTLYWEEHASEGDATLQAFDLRTHERKLLLSTPGAIVWFWVNPLGIMAMDDDKITWHGPQGPVIVSTPGKQASFFWMDSTLPLVVWLEWDPEATHVVAPPWPPAKLRAMDLDSGRTHTIGSGLFHIAWGGAGHVIIAEDHFHDGFVFTSIQTLAVEDAWDSVRDRGSGLP